MTVTKTLGPLGVAAFENRRISVETAVKYGVYTGTHPQGGGEVVPDPKGNVIVFPYIDRGVEVSTKYRAPRKKFWQKTGGKRTFWNADVLDDPALQEGRAGLVITEGEIDALSVLSAGYPFATSVPDGAPSVPAGKTPEELDPMEDTNGKFEFLWNNRERLDKIKRFIIASDSDAPGQRLAAELVRRLSAVRCSYVTYPEAECIKCEDGTYRPCKDLNEVLMTFGPEMVTQIILEAKPYPVRGLYRLKDYPEQPDLETFTTGFDGWKSALRVFLGEFMVVSGIPSHGKTAWTMNLIANLVSANNWTAAVCSPEMPTVPMLRDRLRRYWLGKKADPKTEAEAIARADAWIGRRFVFIDIDPTGTGDSDDPFDLEWIIDRAKDAVVRDGIRVLLIDPWNEIEHARLKGESGSEYVARGIRMLKRFARLYGVMVVVVAHPTKDVGKDGKSRPVTLYDIEHSAAWYNKADHGIIISRDKENRTDVDIQKVRFEGTGGKGSVAMQYNRESGRFEQPVSVADLT